MRGVGRALEDRRGGRQAARAGHGRVHHDDVRLQLGGQRDRFVAVARFADDRDRRVVFEQAAEAAPHERVVVGEQDGDRVASCGSVAGAVTAAPSSRTQRAALAAGARHSSVPPSSSARSRMATSPSPRARRRRRRGPCP